MWISVSQLLIITDKQNLVALDIFDDDKYGWIA